MSCRMTPAGSAYTTFARLMAGRTLSDQAVLSLFHEIKRNYTPSYNEAYNVVSEEKYHQNLDRMIANVQRSSDALISPANKITLIERLNKAKTFGLPSKAMYDALNEIESRVRNRKDSMERFAAKVAREMGLETAAVLKDYIALAARRDSIGREEITENTKLLATEYGLGQEEGLLYATQNFVQQVNIFKSIQAAELEAAGMPKRIVMTQVTDPAKGYTDIEGITVTAFGYDPRNRRVEVEVYDASTGETTNYAYLGDQNTKQRLNAVKSHAEGSYGLFWVNHLRGKSDLQYFTEEDAKIASYAPRCTTCGQFADTSHACPTRIEPRVLTFDNTKAQWSKQATSDGYKVHLPPVMEVRNALMSGAVTLKDIKVNEGWNAETSGDITLFINDEGNIKIDANKLVCNCEDYLTNGTCRHFKRVLDAAYLRAKPAETKILKLTPAKREASFQSEAERLIAEKAEIEAKFIADTEAAQRKYAAEVEARRVSLLKENWAKDQVALAEASRTWLTDQELLYSENFDEFKKDYEELSSKNSNIQGVVLPYIKSNALGGYATRESGQGFGVEIEYAFPPGMDDAEKTKSQRAIATELYALNLTRSSSQEGYGDSHRRGYANEHVDANGRGTWSLEKDGTVAGEIVSPTMYDEPETWDKLEQVIEVLTRNGAAVTKKVGGHVHVGTAFYGGDPAKYTELARLFNQHEDVIYRIASDPVRRSHRASRYAEPNGLVPPEGFSDISAVKDNSVGRTALNFANLKGDATDHVEFRVFDGTLNAAAIQAHIKLAVTMTHAANRNSQNGGTSRWKEPQGSHYRKREDLLQENKLEKYSLEEETGTLRSFLDTLFSDREDKKQFLSLFSNNEWIAAIKPEPEPKLRLPVRDGTNMSRRSRRIYSFR